MSKRSDDKNNTQSSKPRVPIALLTVLYVLCFFVSYFKLTFDLNPEVANSEFISILDFLLTQSGITVFSLFLALPLPLAVFLFLMLNCPRRGLEALMNLMDSPLILKVRSRVFGMRGPKKRTQRGCDVDDLIFSEYEDATKFFKYLYYLSFVGIFIILIVVFPVYSFSTKDFFVGLFKIVLCSSILASVIPAVNLLVRYLRLLVVVFDSPDHRA